MLGSDGSGRVLPAVRLVPGYADAETWTDQPVR